MYDSPTGYHPVLLRPIHPAQLITIRLLYQPVTPDSSLLGSHRLIYRWLIIRVVFDLIGVKMNCCCFFNVAIHLDDWKLCVKLAFNQIQYHSFYV